MDAMGLSNKKSHTVSTSHSGSFTHNPAESPKTPGIVSKKTFGVKKPDSHSTFEGHGDTFSAVTHSYGDKHATLLHTHT